MLNTVSFLFGILSFTVPKLAVAAMLSRILNPGRLAKTWLWFLTGLAAAVSCVCIVILFTMCSPPRALWEVPLLTPQYGATCKSVWILVDYAIFTGCALTLLFFVCSIPKLIRPSSPVCVCGSLACRLSHYRVNETSYVPAEEAGSLCCSWTWFYVSQFDPP